MTYTTYSDLYKAYDHSLKVKADTTDMLKRFRSRVSGTVRRAITDARKKIGKGPIVRYKWDDEDKPVEFTVVQYESYQTEKLRYCIDAHGMYGLNANDRTAATAYVKQLAKALDLPCLEKKYDGDAQIHITIDGSKLDIIID